MRKEMVSRTISGTKVVAKVVNKDTDNVSRETFMLGKAIEDEAKIFKAVAKVLPEELTLIRIEEHEKVDKLYGVDLNKFMEIAVELDPETRKPIAQ